MQPTKTTTAPNTLPEMTSAGLLDAARALLAFAPNLDDAGLARCLEVFDGAYRTLPLTSKPLGRLPARERAKVDALSEARRTAERAICLTLARRPGRTAWAGTTRLILDKHGDLVPLDPARVGPEFRSYTAAMATLYPEPAAREGRAS